MVSVQLDNPAREAASFFKQLDIVELLLDDDFANAATETGSGTLQMQTRAFKVSCHDNALCELRGIRLQSQKINIENLFVFPEPGILLPLHVLEIVLLNNKPIVGIVDQLFMHTEDKSATPVMKKTRADNFQLPNSDDIPDWFEECRSGSEFFLRPESIESIERLKNINNNLLQAYATMALEQAVSVDHKQQVLHRENIESYKQHHAANAPGRPLLDSVFGKEWTGSYLNNCLFG